MTTLIWCAIIGACISYWWTRHGNKMFGVSPLPPGYTIHTTSAMNYGLYQSLILKREDETIVVFKHVEIDGYRNLARKAVRAAWAHYDMTKVEDSK